MSTNKTKNYQLHQWSPSDRVSLSEVNANFTALDAAVAGVKAEAARAQEAAEALPYVIGTYTGTGEDLEVHLGFKPRFLIVSGTTTTTSGGSSVLSNYNVMTAGNIVTNRIVFTSTGFKALAKTSDAVFPNLTYADKVYDYIAFK